MNPDPAVSGVETVCQSLQHVVQRMQRTGEGLVEVSPHLVHVALVQLRGVVIRDHLQTVQDVVSQPRLAQRVLVLIDDDGQLLPDGVGRGVGVDAQRGVVMRENGVPFQIRRDGKFAYFI